MRINPRLFKNNDVIQFAYRWEEGFMWKKIAKEQIEHIVLGNDTEEELLTYISANGRVYVQTYQEFENNFEDDGAKIMFKHIKIVNNNGVSERKTIQEYDNYIKGI